MNLPGFIVIPSGETVLGCKEYPERYPQVRMRISRPFQLMAHVITQGEWKSLMGSEPWLQERGNYERILRQVPFGDDLPAINLTQIEAAEYAQRKSQVLGHKLTLPPETFWEYACRASAQTDYYWGDDPDDGRPFEWLDWGDDTPAISRPGLLKPNGFGLYDMTGNVNEIVADKIHDLGSAYLPAKHYASDTDFVSREGDYTVLRSAHAASPSISARCAQKTFNHCGSRQMFAGFRLASIPWLSD